MRGNSHVRFLEGLGVRKNPWPTRLPITQRCMQESGQNRRTIFMMAQSRHGIVTTILAVSRYVCFALLLEGCDKSELAKVNAQQLTSEEQANIALFAPFARAVAEDLDQYDRRMSEAANAQTPDLAQEARAQAAVLLERERVGARQAEYNQAEWRQIVPYSMNGLRQALLNCRATFIRIKEGDYVSDEELLQLFRDFRSAEQDFRELTASRPLQAAGSAPTSIYLYVTLRGAPIIYESTRGELYLGPTVPIGPFDVNPILGPIGSSKGGTPLQRLVIRDPETKTQRAWMLNNRMPRLSVPASYIETEGTDLVITPR
jgi:hypothetical protein